MLIATLGPTTAWAGKQITHEGTSFVLEGQGPITAATIMDYDREGHLSWVNDGTRAWVGSKAAAEAAPFVAAFRTSRVSSPSSSADPAPAARARTLAKRALMLAIAVLVIVNVGLLLVVLGAFR